MHELEGPLAGMRNAWIAGRSALEQAPAAWREAVGEDELALLALAGHATDVLTRQTPAAPLAPRPPLPMLSAPLLPNAQRARFRRLLAAPKNLPSLERPLIALITARGFAAHPADWMPGVKDDWAPDLYAPWLDWARADARVNKSEAEISAANYDDWSWTERRQKLTNLRTRDPGAALQVIAAKAAQEPAERRVRLIELLQINLTAADADYLESLAKDRSDRVQALARGFLARLGRNGDADALAAELAEMIELNKTGLIKRRTQLSFKALKTTAQMNRRRELFKLVSLAALAQSLGTTDLALVESAPDGIAPDVLLFNICVAETGLDEAVRTLVRALIEQEDAQPVLFEPLAPRLRASERRDLLIQIVRRDGNLFEHALILAGDHLGETPLSAFRASPHYSAFGSFIETATHGEDGARQNASRILDIALPRLGLLLDVAGARAMLDQFSIWGLSSADPRLDMLHFNAALTPENAL